MAMMSTSWSITSTSWRLPGVAQGGGLEGSRQAVKDRREGGPRRRRIRKSLLLLKENWRNGGERGIRTLDGLLTHTPLAGERLQPLGHLSDRTHHFSRNPGARVQLRFRGGRGKVAVRGAAGALESPACDSPCALARASAEGASARALRAPVNEPLGAAGILREQRGRPYRDAGWSVALQYPSTSQGDFVLGSLLNGSEEVAP